MTTTTILKTIMPSQRLTTTAVLRKTKQKKGSILQSKMHNPVF